jgi:alkylmercury lyase
VAEAARGRSVSSLARPLPSLRPDLRNMSDADQPPMGDPSADLLSRASNRAAAVRRAAFARLRSGVAVASTELATDTGLSSRAVDTALSELVASGTANLDGSGHVVAVGGLSVEPAAHELFMDGVNFWTWCAFDAVGIPAALGLDAIARTRCGQCGGSIEITISRGSPQTGNPIVGWLPGQTCENVQDDFCPQANLFCNEAHLALWQTSAGNPPGRVAALIDLAAHGRDVWAEMHPAENPS